VQKLSLFVTKTPILGLFGAFFGTFWHPGPPGGGAGSCHFSGRAGRGTGRGRSPPFQGFRRKRQGGGENFFRKKNFIKKKNFFIFFFYWPRIIRGHRAITGIQQAISCMTVWARRQAGCLSKIQIFTYIDSAFQPLLIPRSVVDMLITISNTFELKSMDDFLAHAFVACWKKHFS